VDLPQLPVAEFQAFLCCLARMAALVGSLPVFSSAQVPVQVRLGLAVLLLLSKSYSQIRDHGSFAHPPFPTCNRDNTGFLIASSMQLRITTKLALTQGAERLRLVFSL
jgi:hypothetical protein